MDITNYQALLEKLAEGQRFNYLLFGQAQSDSRVVNSDCLSPWFPSPFKAEGALFKSLEHFMVAEKARLFKDLPSALKAIMSKTPQKAHKVSKTITGVDNALWATHCEALLVKANYYKFREHQVLTDYLTSTEERILVFADREDILFGAGLPLEAEEMLADPFQWPGENKLGFALMAVRDLLCGKGEFDH